MTLKQIDDGLNELNDAGTKAWNQTLQEKVQTALAAKLDGDFSAINYPAGFNYHIQPRFYNLKTLSTLNSRVGTKNGNPEFVGTFTEIYKEFLSAVKFKTSKKDRQRMTEEEAELEVIAQKVREIYLTSELPNRSQYDTVSEISRKFMTYTGIKKLADFEKIEIKEDFPGLIPLYNNLSNYLNKATFSNKIIELARRSELRLESMIGHITEPTEANGGLKTDDTSFYIGWDKLPNFDQLTTSLAKTDGFNFSLSTNSITGKETSVNFSNKVNVNLPFSWLFTAKTEHSSDFQFTNFAKSGAKTDIEIKYTGLTLVSAIPTALTDNNQKGWFLKRIIDEVYQNIDKDATGFAFSGSDASKYFGPKGFLKRAQTFVIAQQPTITMKFSNFDVQKMYKEFNEKTQISISAFGGLVKGNNSNQYSYKNFKVDERTNTLEVTMTPAAIGSKGIDQTAFVLGGVIEQYE